jgi:uncharacterized protein YndB with AHSA1/START domain
MNNLIVTSSNSKEARALPQAKELQVVAEPGSREITTRRIVNAPPALLYEAFTQCKHLKHWMGGLRHPMTSCSSDVRVGGVYRFTFGFPGGMAFECYGEYRELQAPHRLVRTFSFTGYPGEPCIETLTLEACTGGTLITTHSQHQSVAGRDAHYAEGRMAEGMKEGYLALDALLKPLDA